MKLSIPMMLAMLVQTIYNLADGIWVAGLGPYALAAIGLFFPIFMVIISLAAGIGVGASSVVSQKIGERDKEGADTAASVSILFSIVIGFLSIAVILPFISDILIFAGAQGETLRLALEYSVILVYFIPLIMFNNVANGVFRGEGDAKRAMVAITIGSLLNIGLDPVFIYVFGMGVRGAAYATVVSIAVSSLLIAYWMFFKKDTYVSFRLKWDGEILKRILKIGIPASLAQASMSVAIYVLNVFAVRAGGDYGVAVFTSAWRVINFGTVPLIGMAMAVTSVTGAAFGERNGEKLETAHLYAVKLGFFVGLAVMFTILIFAPYIARLFTYSQEGEKLYSDLVKALRILSLFLPGVPFGMFTSSMFQGVGQGLKSLIVTIMRTVIMQVVFSWLFVFVLRIGLVGVWWGIVLGNATSAFITFNWGRFTVKHLKRDFQKNIV
ncbi:MATE family efflux transporter [Thermotoga petrophila]